MLTISSFAGLNDYQSLNNKQFFIHINFCYFKVLKKTIMLKKILIGIAVLVVLLFAGYQFMKYNTKKASPEVSTNFSVGDVTIDLFYCSPKKRGRNVFEEVVSYGSVWRTGANEPSTISFSDDLRIENNLVPAGKYSIWTIPGEMEWSIILNSDVPNWGVGFDGKASRDVSKDILNIKVPAITTEEISESLEININNSMLEIKWDDVAVRAEIQPTN